MKTLCICYDLHEPDRNYDELHDAIKSYGIWWHHLESTWFIRTDVKAQEVLTHLSSFIDDNDEILVFAAGTPWWGKGFTKRAFDWLHKYL